MRFAFLAVALSGILGCGGSQPQSQPARGPQIGESTAPLPPDPNAPPAQDDTGPRGVSVPMPSSGDVGSPNAPGPTTTPPAAPGAEQPNPGSTAPGGTPGTTQPGTPNSTPDAGVWSPPPDAP